MILSKRAVAEYLDRDFDDWRWMKKLSRADIERELAGLRVKPLFKTDPWLHQLVCFYIALVCPRFLYLLDMGTGKTKIHSDIITHLLRTKKIDRALVTVPRLINIDSWEDDLAVHSDLGVWPVGVPSIEEKRDLLLNPKGDVTVIDFQGLQWALCKKGKKGKLVRDNKLVEYARRLYGYVGIDESHKLSNHDNLWHGLMHQMCKDADYVYASTGTLFGKDVEAIWSQFYLVDGGETFGENLGPFRKAFFTSKPHPWNSIEYTFDKAAMPRLTRMLQHRSLRYDEDEVLDLPRRVPRATICEMTPEQQGHYLRALEGLINAGGQLDQLDAQWLRMRQITSGYLKWKDDHGDHLIVFKQNPKMDALESLVDEMGDSKIVICYDYTQTGKLICDRIKAMGLDYEWYYGGTKDQSASRRRFMEDPKCRVFVMNSEAGGTGNDGLQKVARYMVFYETPCPPITRAQTEKRIHRSGQTKRVFIYDIIMHKSLDRGILDNLKEGIDTHASVVNGRRLPRQFFLADAR